MHFNYSLKYNDLIRNYSYDFYDYYWSFKEKENRFGYFGKFVYNLINRYLNLSLEAARMSKNYFADMGKIHHRDYYSWLVNATQNEDVNSKLIKTISSRVQVQEQKENISNNLIEKVTTTYFSLESQNNLNFWINYVFGKENYAGKIFNNRNLTLGLSWTKLNLLTTSFSFSTGELLIYEFNQTFKNLYLQYAISGFINKYISYYISLDNIGYFDVPASETNDDNYIYGNADITITLSNKISLTNGLRFNNYEWYGFSDHYGIFSNFRWEFRPGCNLFIGYKSSSDEIDNAFYTEYEQLFLKISYRL